MEGILTQSKTYDDVVDTLCLGGGGHYEWNSVGNNFWSTFTRFLNLLQTLTPSPLSYTIYRALPRSARRLDDTRWMVLVPGREWCRSWCGRAWCACSRPWVAPRSSGPPACRCAPAVLRCPGRTGRAWETWETRAESPLHTTSNRGYFRGINNSRQTVATQIYFPTIHEILKACE